MGVYDNMCIGYVYISPLGKTDGLIKYHKQLFVVDHRTETKTSTTMWRPVKRKYPVLLSDNCYIWEPQPC